jgi:hypothetical protein
MGIVGRVRSRNLLTPIMISGTYMHSFIFHGILWPLVEFALVESFHHQKVRETLPGSDGHHSVKAHVSSV